MLHLADYEVNYAEEHSLILAAIAAFVGFQTPDRARLLLIEIGKPHRVVSSRL
jgi:hypothetical protein